jgi:hypothetical protein
MKRKYTFPKCGSVFFTYNAKKTQKKNDYAIAFFDNK